MLHMTDIEKLQKESGKYVPDIPASSTRIVNSQLELLNNFFFRKQDLYISKHNRFAEYPLHTHQFTELNYMLHGSCQQIVNGHPVTLRQGDLLLIGVGTGHEIKPLGEGDLLINILFNKSIVTVDWLNQVKSNQSPLIQYLFNLALGKSNTNVSIVFNTGTLEEVQAILKKIISEYYSADQYSGTLAVLYLPILFTMLARTFNQTEHAFSEFSGLPLKNQKMIPVLQLIEDHYKDITLAQAADLLGYNKTYLGNLIKRLLGVTFTQLVTRRRLYQARLLLNATDLPISDVAHESGFSNKTHFYKVFKEAFGYLPSEEKKQHLS